jgi:homoserine trans-succinylase
LIQLHFSKTENSWVGRIGFDNKRFFVKKSTNKEEVLKALEEAAKNIEVIKKSEPTGTLTCPKCKQTKPKREFLRRYRYNLKCNECNNYFFKPKKSKKKTKKEIMQKHCAIFAMNWLETCNP